jgi:RNA polymerase sigma factor (TIGR02999 family)
MRGDVTLILEAIDRGDAGASERLLPLVYDELRALAAHRMAREAPGQSLQATGLVHEAYLRLLGPDDGDGPAPWDGRGHFFAAAAEAMRRILIDRARARNAIKRGGSARHFRLDPEALALDEVPAEILDLDDALSKLAAEDREKADLVKLRFFAGLTLRQAAAVLGISPTTADRHWAYARAWLFDELGGDG